MFDILLTKIFAILLTTCLKATTLVRYICIAEIFKPQMFSLHAMHLQTILTEFYYSWSTLFCLYSLTHRQTAWQAFLKLSCEFYCNYFVACVVRSNCLLLRWLVYSLLSNTVVVGLLVLQAGCVCLCSCWFSFCLSFFNVKRWHTVFIIVTLLNPLLFLMIANNNLFKKIFLIIHEQNENKFIQIASILSKHASFGNIVIWWSFVWWLKFDYYGVTAITSNTKCYKWSNSQNEMT